MAAGRGTRLRPLTDTTPKPLLPLAHRGTLLRVFDELPDAIDRVIVVVGYLHQKIRAALGEAYAGRPVEYVLQDPLDGTGGALRRAHAALRFDRFLVVNGDDLYCREDLEALCRVPRGALVRLQPLEKASDVWTLSDGRLRTISSQDAGTTGWMNIGAYMLGQEWFETRPTLVPGKTDEWSLPHAIPQLVDRLPYYAVPARFWQPCGTPEEMRAAERMLQEMDSKY